MIKYLIKSTNEVRLETMDDVEQFHKNLQKEAEEGGYTLSTFSWAEKEVKAQGEVIETYYQVKFAFVFNTLKDPERPYKSIEFNLYNDMVEDGE